MHLRRTLPLALLAALLVPPLFAEVESRLVEPVTVHGYHPFRALESSEAWPERQREIRDRVLLASGLLPLPERTPLKAKRFGAVEGDGFRVERVYFESFPGHYVTGNLFTPAGESLEIGLVDGKRPGVLSPHGHWNLGRFYDLLEQRGERAVREEIARGGERFETAARNPILARAVQLARMGCVVFSYDMIGYADSVQLVEHRRGPREGMDGSGFGEWGFVSAQAELRLQTEFGLQSWNSLRALDFLAELEEVDPGRILVTGASGGATQTMVLAAIDERVAASFPAVMVSTAMQGGCTCENAHYLRIGQGNIEIGGALAPKPLGLTAADDWTIELEEKGHPELVALYEGLGARDRYEAHFDVHFKHNFNHVSRSHLYQFANRHLGLGLEGIVLERDYEFLGPEEIGVWSDPAMRPESFLEGEEHELDLLRRWTEDSEAALARALASLDAGDEGDEGDAGETGDAAWLARAWELILRPEAMSAEAPAFELAEKEVRDGLVEMLGGISPAWEGQTLRASIRHPAEWNGELVIQIGPAGLDERGDHGKASHIALALYGQGEEGPLNVPVTYSRNDEVPADSWQRSGVYFYGYNDSVFVRRAHDLAAAVRMARAHPDWEVKRLVVRAEGPFAAIAAAARLLAGDAIDALELDPTGFDFDQIEDIWDEHMVPGAVKYGGVGALLRLAAAASGE